MMNFNVDHCEYTVAKDERSDTERGREEVENLSREKRAQKPRGNMLTADTLNEKQDRF